MSSAAIHHEIEGTLVASDAQSRQLTIHVAGTDLTTSVSPGAAIRLHGEPVRLRMLQVGDHVRVDVAETSFGLIARSVEAE